MLVEAKHSVLSSVTIEKGELGFHTMLLYSGSASHSPFSFSVVAVRSRANLLKGSALAALSHSEAWRRAQFVRPIVQRTHWHREGIPESGGNAHLGRGVRCPGAGGRAPGAGVRVPGSAGLRARMATRHVLSAGAVGSTAEPCCVAPAWRDNRRSPLRGAGREGKPWA